MRQKDNYEVLCKFYEIMVGSIPDRDQFKDALKMTIAEDALSPLFMMPVSGNISFSKLLKKSGMNEDDLMIRLQDLASEGFVLLYETDKGLVCERGNPVFMAEQQVRKPEATPQRKIYAKFFNRGIEGDFEEAIETKTPYYRVLPVEQTITGSSALRTLDIDVTLPAPGEVLPIDIVTDLVKKEATLIGVANCFCRLTKRELGDGCDHPLETCFVFNEHAQSLINYGSARKIDFTDMVRILRDCEKQGLVHNVDNCTKNIRSLCNCCQCCCVLLKSINRGEDFAGSSSRYTVNSEIDTCKNCKNCIALCPTGARKLINGKLKVDVGNCIGCGLCVTACPEGVNTMMLKYKTAKIPTTFTKLYTKIGREALFSIIRKKVFRV